MFRSALNLICICLFLFSFSVQAESGPDNGTDAVKIRFAEAKTKLVNLTEDLTAEKVKGFGLKAKQLEWLLFEEDVATLHLDALKVYLARMRLDFQTAPCEDNQGRTASICYFDQDPRDPYVLISLQENRETTSEQAMAMLIHEAGHFVGEKDHLFLDQLGTDLVQALLRPKSFSVTVSSTEAVSNIFEAKLGCETGKSQQAQTLLRKAQTELFEMCQSHKQSCDLRQALLSYEGTAHQEPGVGFTMEVTCQLKAVLPLSVSGYSHEPESSVRTESF